MIGRHTVAAVLLVGLIAAVIAAGYAWPQSTATATAASPEGDVVERTTVCPALRNVGDGTESVTAFVDPAASSSSGSITGGADGDQALPGPGQALRVVPDPSNAAISITATGDAVGATASVREYLDRGEEGRGLALASCVPARADWWFVGVSGLPGRIDELLLANPTDSPAVVAVEMLGPAGPIDLVGSGAVVQPGEQEIVRLDSLIPGVSAAALHVTTSGGVIAAALRSTVIDGLIPLGAEFIPAAAAPAMQHTVPGVPAGTGPRDLFLAAGEQDAAVEIEFLTPNGSRAWESGLIPVPAEHVVVVDIAEDLQGAPAAVRIAANHPVTAGVRASEAAALPADATGVLNRVPVADYAWSAAQEPLADRAVLPLSGVSAAAGTVAVTGPQGDVTVAIVTRSADGTSDRQEVAVPGGTVREVAVPVTDRSASLITVQRLSGAQPWYASVTQRGVLQERPILATALGADPSTKVRIPPAQPVLHALGGAG
jgi:hypothetical protein